MSVSYLFLSGGTPAEKKESKMNSHKMARTIMTTEDQLLKADMSKGVYESLGLLKYSRFGHYDIPHALVEIEDHLDQATGNGAIFNYEDENGQHSIAIWKVNDNSYMSEAYPLQGKPVNTTNVIEAVYAFKQGE